LLLFLQLKMYSFSPKVFVLLFVYSASALSTHPFTNSGFNFDITLNSNSGKLYYVVARSSESVSDADVFNGVTSLVGSSCAGSFSASVGVHTFNVQCALDTSESYKLVIVKDSDGNGNNLLLVALDTLVPTSLSPTPSPSTDPTPSPTTLPTPSPSTSPTPSPSTAPTPSPTTLPSPSPTLTPTSSPTIPLSPTDEPLVTNLPISTSLPILTNPIVTNEPTTTTPQLQLPIKLSSRFRFEQVSPEDFEAQKKTLVILIAFELGVEVSVCDWTQVFNNVGKNEVVGDLECGMDSEDHKQAVGQILESEQFNEDLMEKVNLISGFNRAKLVVQVIANSPETTETPILFLGMDMRDAGSVAVVVVFGLLIVLLVLAIPFGPRIYFKCCNKMKTVKDIEAPKTERKSIQNASNTESFLVETGLVQAKNYGKELANCSSESKLKIVIE